MQSQAVDLDGQAEAGDGQHGVKDDGGAGHVGLHVAHAEARLDRDAAGVEGDALAHERDLGGGPGGGVLDLDQARLPGGALADAEDAAEAFLFQALLVPHGDLDGQALGQFLGGVREGFGVEVARRLVDQGTGRVDGLADQGGTVQDRLQGLVGGEVRDDHDVLHRVLQAVLGGAVLGEGVGAHRGALGDGGDVGERRRRKGQGDRADAGELADGRAGGAAERLFGERLRGGELADAGEHEDFGAGFGQAREPVGLVGCAGDAKNTQ